MAKINGGIPISPKQWKSQWQGLSHQLDLNLWNFEVSVGRTGVQIFKKSFDLKRFNTKGSVGWKRRAKKNKGGYVVGSLTESMSLKNSIVYKAEKPGKGKGAVKIFTDPSAFGGTFRHKGFCFAAVHNSDDSSVRTGHVAHMPQRQFMPTDSNDSTMMNDKLKLATRMIFQTFPGVSR